MQIFKYALSTNSLMDKFFFFPFHHYITTTTFIKQIEICLLCVCVCVTSCRPTSGEHVGEVRLCASEARISMITGQQVLLCAIRARHSASLLQTVVLLQESCVFTRRRESAEWLLFPSRTRTLFFFYLYKALILPPYISVFHELLTLSFCFWAEFYL